jgi:hypothetical protein
MASKIICFLRNILGIERFERITRATSNFRYLTPGYIAELENISREEAEKNLNEAVKNGFMGKKHLFYAVDLDLSIHVEQDQIGTTIKVDDFPEIGDSRDIYVERENTREIYVAV